MEKWKTNLLLRYKCENKTNTFYLFKVRKRSDSEKNFFIVKKKREKKYTNKKDALKFYVLMDRTLSFYQCKNHIWGQFHTLDLWCRVQPCCLPSASVRTLWPGRGPAPSSASTPPGWGRYRWPGSRSSCWRWEWWCRPAGGAPCAATPPCRWPTPAAASRPGRWSSCSALDLEGKKRK